MHGLNSNACTSITKLLVYVHMDATKVKVMTTT